MGKKNTTPYRPLAKIEEKANIIMPTIAKNAITASTCMKCGKNGQELNTMNWCYLCQRWCICCGKKVAIFGNGKNLQRCVDCRNLNDITLQKK